MNVDRALPGNDLVQEGLDDLARGLETVPALLVAMAAPRLQAIGLDVPRCQNPQPAHRLYMLLASRLGNDAHSRYNALLARIVSFARAAEHASSG